MFALAVSIIRASTHEDALVAGFLLCMALKSLPCKAQTLVHVFNHTMGLDGLGQLSSVLVPLLEPCIHNFLHHDVDIQYLERWYAYSTRRVTTHGRFAVCSRAVEAIRAGN